MENGSYRRFLNGDSKGLEEIVRDHKDGLVFYLNSIVGNLSLAEELMEETFFRIIIKKPGFRGNNFKTWLYTVGRNLAIDYLRRQARRGEIPLEQVEAQLRDMTDLEQQYLMEERKILIHRAMGKLHPDYRQILWLVYFEGLSNANAGAVMKKTDRQIKNLLYRAKNALKTELEKEEFTYEEL